MKVDSSSYVISFSSSYKGWSLQDIYVSDKAYLFYLIHTHKTCEGIKKIVIEFLKTKGYT